MTFLETSRSPPTPHRVLLPLACTLALAALLAIWPQLTHADACAPYHHPPQSLTTAEHDYRRSVLHILAGEKEGTAFLIDSQHALFLTAHHVVRGASQVTGTFDEPHSPSISLSLVHFDQELDAALLTASDPAALTDRLAFDISFLHQPEQQKVAFLGASYTHIDPATNTITANVKLSPPASDFDYNSRTSLIEFMTSVDDGDSGAPVIKGDDGLVVGMVLRKMTPRLAVARTSIDLITFLIDYRSPTIFIAPVWRTEDALTKALLTEPKALSNLRLARLIQWHWRLPTRPILPDPIKGCDIFTAASNRELGQFAYKLKFMALPPNTHRQLGALAITEADTQRDNGREFDALSLYRIAIEEYTEEIFEQLTGEHGRGYVSALLEGSGYVTKGDATEPQSWFEWYRAPYPTAPDPQAYADKYLSAFLSADQLEQLANSWSAGTPEPRKDDSMAMLFHDYQTALVRKAAFSATPASTTYHWGNALVASSWAEILSDSEAPQALNYQAMGDAFVGLGKFADAANSYSSAWEAGLRNNLTLENFRYSWSLAENRLIGDADSRDLIMRASGFDSANLPSLIEGVEVTNTFSGLLFGSDN